MFDVVLYRPRIPPNTGNIIRLCANSGCRLHLVAPLFALDDAKLRRAGLDYHEYTDVEVHADDVALLAHMGGRRLVAFSTAHRLCYSDFAYRPGDCLLFGSETEGISEALREATAPEARLTLPMRRDSRSLNLSNSVAVAVYEAWRQQGFAGS